MNAGEVMTDWCARCHHMIEQLPHSGGWAHASDEDWSGWGDCVCASTLERCVPWKRGALPGWKHIGYGGRMDVQLPSGRKLSTGPGDIYVPDDGTGAG